MNFLSKFDLLKSPVFFLYKGRSAVSTNIGAILSLILVLILVNSAIISDFFSQKKPTVSIQTDPTETYGRLVFGKENLTIAAKLSDYFGNSFIDPSYFYFSMMFASFDPGKVEAIFNEKYMRVCEESDFTDSDRKLNLSGKSFCPSQKEPLILQGSVTNAVVDYALLHLRKCDNDSARFFNVTCKTKDEIENFLKNKFFFLYYTDNSFDLTDIENPVKRTLNFHVSYYYPQIQKTTTIPIQKTWIYTDRGLFQIFEPLL